MLKKKYLHRRSRKNPSDDYWKRNLYKNINLFDDLPFHDRMRKNCYHTWSDFDLTPLYEFVESKIGEDFDDVYSEILKKVKKKYRHNVDECLFGNRWSWIVKKPIYDEEMIPRDEMGRILKDRIFIDFNNIISQKTEEELLVDSKRYLRKKKMMEILENQKKEQNNDQSESVEN